MGSAFNPQILVGKLAKLNSSQQSIETLSHWCIFHMNKATQVVETWARQFHCAPRDQRLAFLYLANDIIQNSRRKGAEFVSEFWKVLPDSLRDVVENGNETERNAALRLISIWEERKVFGSRGQILKEEFVKRPLDGGNKNSKHAGFKLRPPGGNALDKLVSGYQAVYGSQLDEDAIFEKCRIAISFVEKVDKDVEGHIDGNTRNELKGQHAVLMDCVQQLTVVESSRENLLSILREAVQEQEYKLDQVRSQLQAAQSHSDQADSICRQLFGGNGNGSPVSRPPQSHIPGTGGQTTSVIYTRQIPFAEKSDNIEEDPKSAAAAVAAKLAASSSSAQMLTYVLSSLASEGVITNPIKDSSNEYPSEKRARIEDDYPSYVPSQIPQSNMPITSQELNPSEPPPPPSSPPPLPPLPPPLQPYQVPQYMQTAMPMSNGTYTYSMNQQLPVPLQGYILVGPPANGLSVFAPPSNAYQGYPTEGGFYGQPSSLPMAPMGRQ